MLIENNTLLRIDNEDVIDGVFVAPDDVLYVGNYVDCKNVVKMILPNVIEIGNYFLDANTTIESLIMPKVEKIGIHFLLFNTIIESIDMPNIKEIDSLFLTYHLNFNYTPRIIKALKGDIFVGGKIIDKKEYLRKMNLNKLLC